MANSKKEAFYAPAENMFVLQGMTREEVAKRLQVSDKTVRVWAQRGEWEKKRAAVLESAHATYLELYEVIRKMAKSVSMDVEAGNEISQARLYTLKGLIDSVGNMKKFEDQVNKEAANKERAASPEKTHEETVKALDDLLGVRRN